MATLKKRKSVYKPKTLGLNSFTATTICSGKTFQLSQPTVRHIHKLLLDAESSVLVEEGDKSELWHAMSGTVMDFVGYDCNKKAFKTVMDYKDAVWSCYLQQYKNGFKARWSCEIIMGLCPIPTDMNEDEEFLKIADMNHSQLDNYITLSSSGSRSVLSVVTSIENVSCPLWLIRPNKDMEDYSNFDATQIDENGYLNTVYSRNNPVTLIEHCLKEVADVLEMEDFKNYNLTSLQIKAKVLGV